MFLYCKQLFLILMLVCGFCWESHAKVTGNAVYRLGVDDVIKVLIIAGGEQQVEAELVVSIQGIVNVPLIGSVQAKGLTVPELEKELYVPLEKDFFVSPQIHIQVIEYHSLHYFISGAVKEPGLYELSFVPSVMDLIVKAGGVEEGRGNIAYILKDSKLANLASSIIESEITQKEPVKIDLVRLLDQGDMSENRMLTPGDTVYIPLGKVLNQTTSKVYVQGQVKEPGMFDYQPGMTVLSTCILAGGFSKYAAPGRTRIVRNVGENTEILKVDLDRIIQGDAADINIIPGDRIHVPESWF